MYVFFIGASIRRHQRNGHARSITPEPSQAEGDEANVAVFAVAL
jgi:hypothetical protein